MYYAQLIKMSSSALSREAKTVSYYTDDRSNFKMLYLNRYYSYHLVYYRPRTSYQVEPNDEGLPD